MRLFFTCCAVLFMQSTETEVRNLYVKALDDSEKADKLVSTCASRLKIPFYRAYYGSGLGFQAKHAWNPASKLSKAKQASNELNLAVEYASKDFEVRFLRFSYEYKVPSFLGVSGHTTEDKKWLMANLNKKHPMWPTFKKFLKDCDLLSQSEKDGL